jgi:type II secretory pathway pseudopilin PulG
LEAHVRQRLDVELRTSEGIIDGNSDRHGDGKTDGPTGFTLIETLVAATVLLAGVTVVAHLVAYGLATSFTTRQMGTATFLAVTKLEELRRARAADLSEGGSLDPRAPADGYFDLPIVEAAGLDPDSGRGSDRFLRLWRIDGADVKTITLAVFATASSPDPAPPPLAQVSTQVADRF